MTGSKTSKRRAGAGKRRVKHRKHHKHGGSLWDVAKKYGVISKAGNILGNLLPGPYGEIAKGVGAIGSLAGVGRRRRKLLY